MSEQFWTDIDEVEKITDGGLFLVFADNPQGLFSLGIKIRTKGTYEHVMWKIPEGFASQWFWFKLFPTAYFVGRNMKFVHNPNWTDADKGKITAAIKEKLLKPWYKTLYDVPAILGQLLGFDWLQLPGNDICSESAACLGLADKEYAEWVKTEHTPTPTDVNKWTKARPDRYKVFGRYSPD